MVELKGELLERMAEAVHDSYRRGLPKGSRPPFAGMSYAELPEEVKEQNRAAVRDIPAKLAAVGLTIVPLEGERKPLELSGEQIELLAEREHARWMKAKEAAGWRLAAERDDERKLHPAMVPWAELPESERDKDRQQVRNLGKLLAQVGYTAAPAKGG
jgi:hypothetical protein